MRLIIWVILILSFVNVNAQCIENELFIQITPDNYPEEITWQVVSTEDEAIFDSGDFHGDTLCLPDSCFYFRILDSYGDGIIAPGGYRLILNGDTLKENFDSNFGGEEITFFNCQTTQTCAMAEEVSEGLHLGVYENSWFAFSPDSIGLYQISTCSLNSCNTKIFVYENCDGPVINEDNAGTLFYDDDNGGCGFQAVVSAYLDSAKMYYIRIGDAYDNCTDSIWWSIDYEGPIVGCMDTQACNYDPLATVAGDCFYIGDSLCPNGPDLKIMREDIINSLNLQSYALIDECMVEERCINGFGTRDILTFDTHIKNIGDTDYYIGDPSTHPEQFSTDNCHGHIHYKGYAEYLLINDQGVEIPIGFKSGFCVMDLACDSGEPKYGCSNMGITSGCGDIYHSGLDCQWIDITSVDDGTYQFIVRTNWTQSPDALGNYESDYSNNITSLCVTIDRSNGFLEFEVDEDCPPYTDCMGEIYGSAQLDCNGNCNGTAVEGDVDQNEILTGLEPQLYIQNLLNETLEYSECIELTGDEDLNVYDVAVLNHCVVNGQLEEDCDFDNGIFNPLDTTYFGIKDLDESTNTFVLYYNSDRALISGLEINFTGIEINNVTSLIDNQNPNFESYWLNNNKLIGIDLSEGYLPTTIEKEDLFLVSFTRVSNEVDICIEEIVAVVNEKRYEIVGVKEENCFYTSVQNTLPKEVKIYPIPSNGVFTIELDNPLIQKICIKNVLGEKVEVFNAVSLGKFNVDLTMLAKGVYYIYFEEQEVIYVYPITIN